MNWQFQGTVTASTSAASFGKKVPGGIFGPVTMDVKLMAEVPAIVKVGFEIRID